ncbi:putative pterin-4-alpha-carbinolamine dehydratase [Vitis vinifera]|uniref:4a-hydroxytetrahydrobiopterin dehydratase n=1 Tax=Vitis vinifera TaxID=29760 RepID=A0A438EI17_VITVI|nr:putative pterin-4-alpha-carbinolamine dehydratase [Vitis vinifera]
MKPPSSAYLSLHYFHQKVTLSMGIEQAVMDGVGPVGQPGKVDDYRLAEESTDSIFTPVFCGTRVELVNETDTLKLNRSWKVKSFTKGLELFQAVADVAEAEGHHPDLHLVGWNNVKIEIWTHAVGGLTENDFILAAKINGLDLQRLLRRKAAT